MTSLHSVALLAVTAACSRTPPKPVSPAEWPDDAWAEIARRVPGFAGWWLDGGTAVLMLVDPTQRGAALEAIAGEFGNRRIRGVRVQRADFDFAQLRVWKDRAVEDTAWVTIDADEMRNRIVVGIEDTSAGGLAATRGRLVALGIPSEALILEGGPDVCIRPGRAAVRVQIRTEDGTPAAAGARLVLDDRDTSWSRPALDAVSIEAILYRPADHVSVRVEKPWYVPYMQRDVSLQVGQCGLVATTMLQVRLNLRPDAPAIRSLYVGHRELFALGRYTSQLGAVLDAEPGISDSVTWSSSDTTVAVVDRRGVMKTQCRNNYREAFMRATLVADTTIRDSLLIGVRAATPGVGGC